MAVFKNLRLRRTRSDMLRHQAARPRVGLRVDVDGPQIAVVDVLQRHRHDAGFAVDIDAAEELHAETGREVFAVAALLVHRLRSKRIVERSRCPGASMERAGDEFPEWLEIPKHRAAG